MTKLSTLVFRLRYPLHLIVFLLGFLAPWNRLLRLDPGGINAHSWGLLAQTVHNLGLGSYRADIRGILVLGIVFALAAALLRSWGSAYIGIEVVKSATMHPASVGTNSEGILTDGPFAHLRNPLYLGTFLHTVALSLLMPPTGAVFAIVAIAALQAGLIFGEEAFLRATIGPPYQAYCALVPRIAPRVLPSLATRIPPSGAKPRWPQAILGETYFWAVALSLAIAGWTYNPALLTQCVIVSLGLSIVARAFAR